MQSNTSTTTTTKVVKKINFNLPYEIKEEPGYENTNDSIVNDSISNDSISNDSTVNEVDSIVNDEDSYVKLEEIGKQNFFTRNKYLLGGLFTTFISSLALYKYSNTNDNSKKDKKLI
jgi:hypothetical protein